MQTFIVVTGTGIVTIKEMQAESLERLIEQISNTIRGKMEYQVFSSRPFNFDTLLYTNRIV